MCRAAHSDLRHASRLDRTVSRPDSGHTGTRVLASRAEEAHAAGEDGSGQPGGGWSRGPSTTFFCEDYVPRT